MSTPISKTTLSPAELAKLEHAFAADPSSDAYKPLAEAYLGMGRFMEAMVVCKKGVKAHPSLAAPRLLLARVYAEQGKDKKALEEVQGALQAQPADKAALRMAGALQLKTGETDAGKANLLKAYEADPSDTETLALLQQYKLEPAKAAAPAPVAAPVVAAPVAPTPVAAPTPAPETASLHSVPAAKKAEPATRPAAPSAPRAETPARAAPVRRPVQVEEVEEEDDEDYDDEPASRRKKAGGAGKYVMVGLVVAAVGLLGGVGGYQSYVRGRNQKVGKQLKVVSEQLKHDSFAGYLEAQKAGEAALEVQADSGAAHASLAYAYAISWGEHGGGDEARAKAEEHLAAAKKAGDTSPQSVASEALLKMYGNKAKEALGPLEERIKALEAQEKPNQLLYLTQGLVLMNLGDLERAREAMEKAQTSAEARVYAALGTLYRRLGQHDKAEANYEVALRYEKGHPESLLGKSLAMLERGFPDYVQVATNVDKLLKLEPAPSPRQLAGAQLARSLLLSRISNATELKDDVKQKLSALNIPTEKDKARAEMLKAEEAGFTLDKQNPELFLIKGRRLLAEGQPESAADEIRRALKMDGSRIHFHVELARALLAKPGSEQAAVDALTSALKTAGDSPALGLMLAHAYRKQGKLDEALAQYQRLVKDPKAKAPEAHLGIGAIHRERSEWDKAQAAFDKAAQEFVGQSDRVALALTELARMYQAKGDATKADETFLRALNANGNFAPAYYFYAVFQKGRPSGLPAKALAQEYLNREPKGEYAPDAQRLATAE